MLTRTKNLTLAIPEETYLRARLYSVGRRTSLSQAVRYLLENLPELTAAVRQLVAERRAQAAAALPAPSPLPQISPGCENVKVSASSGE
jgi:hypothetical protein